MIRRAVLAIAVAVPLALLSACGGPDLPSIGSEPDPDSDKLEGALTTFVDTLGRGEYAAAAALMCPDTGDESALRTEFEPHPRPWTRKITYTSRSNASGNANLDLTPDSAPVVKYTFDLTRLADGSWQVCDVTRGSLQVDVG